MFDAKKLLDQVMTSARSGDLSALQRQAQQVLGGTGLGAGLGGALGGSGAGAPPSAAGGSGDLLKGALAGGVVGLLLGNKKARKFAGGLAGTALKVGGVAAVAAVAYNVWRSRQGAAPATLAPAGAGAAAPLGASGPLALPPPPADSPFSPANAPGGEEALARGVLVAMIQGAKADGHIDADEQRRIFDHVASLGLDSEAKAFVMDELAGPADLERVARHATSPEVAAELYAAALLAMTPDAPAERAWLDRLADRMGLDRGLAAELERAVREAL